MADALEFPDVSMESMGHLAPGRMKFTEQDAIFRNSKTGRQFVIKANELDCCQWIRIGNRPALKLLQNNGTFYRFAGFSDADFERISNFAKKNWKQDLGQVEPSVRGWNWGNAKFKGDCMSFEVENKPAFEIPLKNVNQVIQNKNEVSLEFHQNDDAPACLMEMRFHIPDEADGSLVQKFHDNVLTKAGIVQVTGNALATLREILCATPRGRYDIKIYPTFIQLRGKSFDYKIPVTTILRLFLLPHKDGRRMFFVISLDPPIKQGQTRYHNLILEFTKEEEIDLELELPEDAIKEKYEGNLTKQMKGPLYEVVSRLMKVLVNKKITVPGNFVGNSGTPAISCAYKNASGLLYPLERGFMYVHKPPIHIRFEEIATVNFARSDVSTRSFDFEVETKSSATYTFTNIEKEEYGKMFDFVTGKKLRCKNMGKRMDQPSYKEDEGAFDSSEEEVDPYKERLKKEAEEREEEESSSEEDSDYNPESEKKKKESSASGSEPDEEYDSKGGSSDEDSDGGSKKKPAPKPKRKASESSAASGSGSASETERPPKKAPKPVSSAKGKKEKAVKDPNAPKKPSSGYILWLNENRDKIKEPGMSVTEVAKKAGVLWKELKDKSTWEKKAADDKKRYERQMAEYKKSGGQKPTSSGASTSKSSPSKTAKSKEFVEDSSSSAPEEKSGDDSD